VIKNCHSNWHITTFQHEIMLLSKDCPYRCSKAMFCKLQIISQLNVLNFAQIWQLPTQQQK
jgi:hypothetical protein